MNLTTPNTWTLVLVPLMTVFASWTTISVTPAVAQEMSPEQITLASNGVRILNTYCKKCHGDNQYYPGLIMTDRGELLKPSNGEDAFIVAGDAEGSRVWQQIVSESMPPSNQPQPSAEDQRLLRQWIEAGAMFPPPARKQREFLGDRTILKMISDDLNSIDTDDVAYTRYFTLAHLWNDTQGPEPTTDEDLRFTRAAVSKLANSLSTQPRIVPPRIVDPEYGTLMAIDIRDYGWTADTWDMMLTYYPYALKHGGDDERRIYKATEGCITPVIRADWFVNTASRPPLYHRMLDIPSNAKTLERRLGVDIPYNFEHNRLMRAAFTGRDSGVSEQNRMVERHDQSGSGRAYWKSYDMLPGAEREHDFMRAPLGPPGISAVHQRAQFRHDGGEIIYNLPNGLQAYMLVDGEDRRIDIGPPAVVRDPNQHAGGFEIVNGISCMGCHKQGMIKWTGDIIRPGFENLEGQRTADKVMNLYPKDEDFFRIVDEDRKFFLEAMNKACGDFLLGSERSDRASQYHQFFVDVMLAKDAKFDSAAVREFCQQQTSRDIYNTMSTREAVIQLAALGKEKQGWDISIDGVLAMYELSPMTQRKGVEDFADPITYVAKRYFRDVTLNDAARELGLPLDPETAEAMNQKSVYDLKAICDTREFRSAGMGTFARKGGTISRSSWEEFYGRIASMLGQGIPIEHSNLSSGFDE